MDLVFKETLRMNAPVGMIARQAIKDTEIHGPLHPAGHADDARPLPHPAHGAVVERPRRASTPSASPPERREDASHKYAWTPFGGNVHKCIGMHFGGMEVKAILHQLLLRNSWTRAAPATSPSIDYGTGPFPADGLPINLTAVA